MTLTDWIQAISMVVLVGVTIFYAWRTFAISRATKQQADASAKMAKEMKEQRYSESLPLLVPDITRRSIVDKKLESNEVVGLIGDNGAGKSTLIKILNGLYSFDAGCLYIKNNKIAPNHYSVKKAQELGIETVYQEKALGEKHTVWRNIFVGRELTTGLGFLRVAKMKQATNVIMTDFLGFRSAGLSADSIVSTMSGGERQGIAIGRAMYFDADLVILDEPTIALSVKEIGKVLNFVQRVKDRGKSCIYISHTISLIYSVSDRFVILDRGKVTAEYTRDEISEGELMKQLIHHASQT